VVGRKLWVVGSCWWVCWAVSLIYFSFLSMGKERARARAEVPCQRVGLSMNYPKSKLIYPCAKVFGMVEVVGGGLLWLVVGVWVVLNEYRKKLLSISAKCGALAEHFACPLR